MTRFVTYKSSTVLRLCHPIPALLTLLILVCGIASAESPIARLSCGLSDTESTGLSGDASINIHAVSDYIKTINMMLNAGEFDRLDCLANSARSSKERFPGGMWKLHAIYSGLAQPLRHATEDDWHAHMDLLQRWLSSKPESITARVALAEAYVNYGEDARGSGFADSVSESGWKLLAERTAKAKEILDASTQLTKDPEWYVAMQLLVVHQSWELSAREALLEEAVKFEPGYYYYYRYHASSIQSKWGGEEGDVARFLQKTADQIGGDAGDIVYFRVAGTLVCGCQDEQKLNLSWPRILKGFDAVEKRDGASPENWNLLAHMAPSFGDAVVANKMFDRIGDQWSEDIWHDSSTFESSKHWAKQVAPFMARKQAAEDSAEANLHAPEGEKYNAAFAEKINTWMQPCLKSLAAGDLGNFELLIKVSTEGAIADITGGGHSPVMQCLGGKLNEFRQGKQAVFSPPPRPDYWVRFDLNPAGSTSAALK